jgi:hypothetical protein
VHIKIPEFGDQGGFHELTENEKKDEATHEYMELQRQKFCFVDVEVLPWEASLAATNGSRPAPTPANPALSTPKSSNTWRVDKTELSHLLVAPMKTCLRCRHWHQKRCPYRKLVTSTWAEDEALRKQAAQWLAQALNETSDKKARWKFLEPLRIEFKQRLPATESDPRGVFYCTFAHWVNDWQHHVNDANESALRKIGADILIDIDTFGLD